jgi:ElaB/YqjD/DUF883 family membrane-anchored ribosome-binding protein
MKNEYGKNYENNKERLADYGQATMNKAEEKVEEIASEAQSQLKQGEHKLTHLVTKIDKQLRDDPWPLVVGVGLGCLLLGTLLGAFKKNT